MKTKRINFEINLPSNALYFKNTALTQWDESGRVSSTNTCSTVFDGFIGNGEFTKIVTDHFGFNFNIAKNFSVINTNNSSYHLWKNDEVSQVGLDWLWLFSKVSVSGSFSSKEFFDKVLLLWLESSLHLSSNSSWKQLVKFLFGLVEQLVEFDSSVRVGTKSSFLNNLRIYINIENKQQKKGLYEAHLLISHVPRRWMKAAQNKKKLKVKILVFGWSK